MAIFRGTGGQGDSTTDTTVTTVTQKAAEAASSATSASNSATSAANSASSASTSETNAATSESNAASSESNAASSATTASNQADQASTFAGNAANSAYNAQTFRNETQTLKSQTESLRDTTILAATAAATSADEAETAYSNTLAIFGDAQDVQDAVDSASASATTATTKATEAATSATNAANSAASAGTSETNAATSELSASTFANTAGSHANDAQTAQTAAETAQAAAEAAETAAETAQVAAETAQVAAETAETNAASSATSASTSATNAATSNTSASNAATASFNHASAAASSVQTATTRASEAATSATAASTAQTAAETAQAAAEAAQEAIDGLYLGTNTTNPTVDLNGNPVTAGDWYFNTTDNTTRIYDGANWNTVNPDLVGDSSPQLGGVLDTNGNNIEFGDSTGAEVNRLKFGASDDLQIYHNGSNSYIDDGGTGDLILQGSNAIRLRSSTGENMGIFNANGAVTLQHDNLTKFATTSSGVDITGTLVSDGLNIDSGVFDINLNGSLDALPADNDESHIFTTSGSGSGFFAKFGALGISSRNKDTSSSDIGFFTDKIQRLQVADGGYIYFFEDTGTTAKLTWDASAEHLKFSDSVEARFGDNSEFRIYHDTSDTYLVNFTQGNIYLKQETNDKDVVIQSDDGSGGSTNYFRADGSNGEAILYHYGSEKLATKSTGIDVTGTVTADGLTVDGGATITKAQGTIGNNHIELISADNTARKWGLRFGSVGNFNLSFDRNFGGWYSALEIDRGTGDISFYDDSGTSQDFYWDASTSRLGINTTAPSTELTVNGTITETSDSTDYNIVSQYDIGTEPNEVPINALLGSMAYQDAEGVNIDELVVNQNLGIGTTNPDKALVVSGVGAEIVINDTDTTDTPLLRFRESGSTSATIFTDGGNLIFTYGSTQAARIDSSGNLLVGTTDSFPGNGDTNTGNSLLAIGGAAFSRDNFRVVAINRNTSDGAIVDFNKDGSTVGSIGTKNGDLTIGTGDTGIFFEDSADKIRPWSPSTNLSRDAAIDIGVSNARWRNLYLSGGVYLGGTVPENLLDDYEEGDWTPTLAFGGASTGITYSSRDGHYIKIGNQVTVHGSIILSNKGSSTGGATVQSLPFTVGSYLSGTTLEAGGIVSYSADFTGALATGGISVSATDGTTELKLKELQQSGTVTNDLEEYHFQNTTTFRFSITYFA